MLQLGVLVISLLKMKNKKKNYSLHKTVWIYFLFFSIFLLGFLWIFQGLFLNQYYQFVKKKDIVSVANIIKLKQDDDNFYEIVNKAAYEREVCVEIINKQYISLYSTVTYGKGCFNNNELSMNYKYEFIRSNSSSKTYELINPKFNNKTFVYAIKLRNDTYAFINTSLEPVDATVGIIHEQLIIVTIVVLALSFIISYFISNYIASPITKISNSAKELAKGNFNTKFDNNSNISEINELADTLNYTKNELSKTDELRRDLMANVSHDLKTPLTMIKAYAEMSKDLHSNSKKKRNEDMDIIVNEVDRLTVLVNDILTLSKMQSNLESLDEENIDLVKLIYDIIGKYDVLKETEYYNFVYEHDNRETIISADRKKLEQVIYNLVNNAINYTGDDKKVIIKTTNFNDGVLVEVIDSGCGIKEEDLPYIWDKYYKNEKKHKRNLVGTGLGLSIVKNILELHNWEYGVNSKKNVGTSFYFKIKRNFKS